MKKYMGTIIVALLVGFLMGRFILNQYDFTGKIIPTINTNVKAYFIQQGVYSSKENMEKATLDFPYYIYMIDGDKYYAYIGITLSEKNRDKIKGYYERKGYITYAKEIKIENDDFLSVLAQYDSLLESSDNEEVIGSVCSQVLNKYEELVLNYGD